MSYHNLGMGLFAYSIVYYGKEGKIVKREQCCDAAYLSFHVYHFFFFFVFVCLTFHFFFFFSENDYPASGVSWKEREPFLKAEHIQSKQRYLSLYRLTGGIHMRYFFISLSLRRWCRYLSFSVTGWGGKYNLYFI